jgi:hypothetical protein
MNADREFRIAAKERKERKEKTNREWTRMDANKISQKADVPRGVASFHTPYLKTRRGIDTPAG